MAARVQPDRLSVDVVSEAITKSTFACHHLGSFFGDTNNAGCLSNPSIRPTSDTDVQSSRCCDKVMAEVAEWLDLDARDHNWTIQCRDADWLLPSRHDVIAALVNFTYPSSEHLKGSFALVHFTALQLLASCTTIWPACSANSVPLLRQKMKPEVITALRLHSHYRFAPAAGHHARDNSLEAGWPGLYNGPSIEDRLAEEVSYKRWLKKELAMSGYVGHARKRPETADDYCKDGPAPSDTKRPRLDSRSSTNSGDVPRGILARLICRSSFTQSKPKPTQRHSEATVSQRRPNPVRSLTSALIPTNAIQKLPEMIGRRRTRSVPRRSSNVSNFTSVPTPIAQPEVHRRSSTTDLRRDRPYPFDIPEIRKISATTAGGAGSEPGGDCEDPVIANEYIDERRLSPIEADRPYYAYGDASTSRMRLASSCSIPPEAATSVYIMHATVPYILEPTQDYFRQSFTFEKNAHDPDYRRESKSDSSGVSSEGISLNESTMSEESIDKHGQRRAGITLNHHQVMKGNDKSS